MDILAKLFGGVGRVRIMRLFLSNPDRAYDNATVAKKSNVHPEDSRWIIGQLKNMGLVKQKTFTAEVERKKGKKKVLVKKKMKGWIVNTNFPYYKSLHNLLIQGRPADNNDILRRIKSSGTMKMVVISGVFIQNPDSRLDLLIVGDKIKSSALDKAVRNLEAEIGKELEYAVFNTDEFLYRVNVYDKLVRDVLEYPHEKILDKLEIDF